MHQQLFYDPLLLDESGIVGGIQFKVGRFPRFPGHKGVVGIFRRIARTAPLIAVGMVRLDEVGREAVEGGFVEFLWEDDLAVELVDWFSPGIRTERVVVDA